MGRRDTSPVRPAPPEEGGVLVSATDALWPYTVAAVAFAVVATGTRSERAGRYRPHRRQLR